SVVEAVEGLLRAGYHPARTVYLTFGHDEEVSGRYGAAAIVAKLAAAGVKPALVLDEGGFMGAGLMPGLAGRAALVGIAEKDNVLPPEASAVVNFRIFPGETIASVTERVTRVVDDSRIAVGLLDSVGANPSPVSDVASPAYRLVATTIEAMAPGERLPVIPYL